MVRINAFIGTTASMWITRQFKRYLPFVIVRYLLNNYSKVYKNATIISGLSGFSMRCDGTSTVQRVKPGSKSCHFHADARILKDIGVKQFAGA